MSCPLCDLYEKREIVTHLWHEDNDAIIVDCKTCGIPMLVVKRHVAVVPNEEVLAYHVLLRKIFGECGLRGARTVSDHWHVHVIRDARNMRR